MKHSDCIVVGSDISGLNIANILTQNIIPVTFLENENAIGSLIKYESIGTTSI